MPSFKYVGNDELEIPTARLIVNTGDTFEVDDDLAAGLEGQPQFEKAKPTKSTATVEMKED